MNDAIRSSHTVQGESYELVYDPGLLAGEMFDVLYPLHTQAQKNLKKYLPLANEPDFVLIRGVNVRYDHQRKRGFLDPTDGSYYSLYSRNHDGTVGSLIPIQEKSTHATSRAEMRFFVGKGKQDYHGLYIRSDQKTRVLGSLRDQYLPEG